MNILLIGSGGREHALGWKLRQSPRVAKIFIAPGNAGTLAVGDNVTLDTNDPEAVIAFARLMGVALVVIGPEIPLVRGLADALRAAGIPTFGPSAAAARLEGSKTFANEVCDAAGVPKAKWERFNNAPKAKMHARALGGPCVVKVDGLAAGKGVTVADGSADATEAVDDAFESGASAIVIEERLEGPEVSMFFLCDGETALPFGTAQDHKRAFDGDQGPNTGGMGAISPAPRSDAALEADILDRFIRPTLAEMTARGMPFHGVLYAGLMLTADGPRLIEYNVRFGDPECQTLMIRYEGDLAETLHAAAEGRLAEVEPSWSDDTAVTVVMAAEGYPAKPKTGGAIRGLRESDDGSIHVFHAGTAMKDGEVVATGGRVLCVTATGTNVEQARTRAYETIATVDWPDGFYRSDIGQV